MRPDHSLAPSRLPQTILQSDHKVFSHGITHNVAVIIYIFPPQFLFAYKGTSVKIGVRLRNSSYLDPEKKELLCITIVT